MFDTGEGRSADETVLGRIEECSKSENRCAARKVMLAADLWDRCVEHDIVTGGNIRDCGNAAAAEIAVRLGASRTMAERYAEVGMDLRLRLPRTRAAFEAGELDWARVAKISTYTTGLVAESVERLEPEILLLARRLSPGPLASEIDALVLRECPEEAAELRRENQRFRSVRCRPNGPTATVQAELSPEEGQQAMQLIAEMADSVCEKDPRDRGHRMADALMALLHGECRLSCRCEREQQCPQYGQPTPDLRRKPLTQITIDMATLLGLLANPAHLAGHGPIDPDLARRLAQDGVWQALLTEARDLAEELGLDIPHPVADEAQDAAEANTPGDRDVASPAEHDGGETSPPRTGHTAPDRNARGPGEHLPGTGPRSLIESFLARGRRLPASLVPDLPPEPGPFAPVPLRTGPVVGSGALTAAIERAIAADPRLALGEFPDGHGGLAAPPPGALTYRPSVVTAALVRARDQHCRFPGCRMPAERCQLDHIVEFRHHAPHAGGWSIPSNLQCLCLFHHQLKTMRLWKAAMLPGGVLYWVSTMGASAVTLPAVGCVLTGPSTLTPHIPRRRRSQESSTVAAPDAPF